MAKRFYICPQCHQQVRDLKGHLARVHPGAGGDSPPAEKGKGKTLELAVKTKEKKEKETPEPKGYHCVDCGAALDQGQNPCPGCGTHLDWSEL